MTTSVLAPILTAPLFEELDDKLIALLESLRDDEWRRPTVVPRWNVRQVAAHLLDTALRRLSLDRDDSAPADAEPIANADDLKRLVNELNARGVAVYAALSTRMLITLLAVAARELREYFLSLDPMQPASWPVSWAGEGRSMNWFDTAREFTERWHHQQQIRMAVERPGIMTPRLYGPVLDTFMRALPKYRNLIVLRTVSKLGLAGTLQGLEDLGALAGRAHRGHPPATGRDARGAPGSAGP